MWICIKALFYNSTYSEKKKNNNSKYYNYEYLAINENILRIIWKNTRRYTCYKKTYF